MLNSTPLSELPQVLPNVLDIDRTLWFLASEIAWTDEDSYVHKGKMDYYVYYEPESGRMVPMEYDGNSVLLGQNSNWSPFYNANKVNYPLLNRLLAMPHWRQRYLAHLRTILQERWLRGNVPLCWTTISRKLLPMCKRIQRSCTLTPNLKTK